MTQQQESPSFLFEKQAYELGYKRVAGIDEAGRGPLAGPVVAAACYLREDAIMDDAFKKVNDSKELDPIERRRLYELLISHPQVVYSIGVIEALTIDKANILQATLQAMLLAVNKLSVPVDYLLIDGNSFPQTSLPGLALIDGDRRSLSIAVASIIAKEFRDDLMREHHKKWPAYGFDQHKGYATREHILAIKAHGVSPIHRRTFEPVRSLVKSF